MLDIDSNAFQSILVGSTEEKLCKHGTFDNEEKKNDNRSENRIESMCKATSTLRYYDCRNVSDSSVEFSSLKGPASSPWNKDIAWKEILSICAKPVVHFHYKYC